jgi:ubiquinone/menaquinone biosynthesis C-methylase UbiE
VPDRTPFSVNWLVTLIHARHVARAVRACAGGRLLDVGCGTRPFADLLEAHSDRSLGIEIDRGRFGLKSNSAEGMIACSGGEQPMSLPDAWASGLHLPFHDGSFDTAVSFQVLEHVPQPARMLAEITRVLRPGGVLVLTAPHIWGIHEEPHDYYRFTPYGLRYLAETVGLRVHSVVPLAGFWVTMGARFTQYLSQFEKLYLHPVTRPLMALIQVVCLAFDSLHRVDSDAWNHMLVARKPRTEKPE